MVLKSLIAAALARGGFRLSRVQRSGYPLDFQSNEIHIAREVQPFTMTSPERIHALTHAVRYVVRNRIPGAFAECGVWRGGSMMAAALTLQALNETRDLYLFDVFDSLLPHTTDLDRTVMGDVGRGGERYWNYVTADEVRSNLAGTGYPLDHLHFVQGKVEETLPAKAPAEIAILRLDTDWYESTRHELEHLYKRLSLYGVLIVDDYGSHIGVRKAVDEFFDAQPFLPLLQRIDSGGVMAIKTGG